MLKGNGMGRMGRHLQPPRELLVASALIGGVNPSVSPSSCSAVHSREGGGMWRGDATSANGTRHQISLLQRAIDRYSCRRGGERARAREREREREREDESMSEER